MNAYKIALLSGIPKPNFTEIPNIININSIAKTFKNSEILEFKTFFIIYKIFIFL